jgi:anti-sigma B factor antagonist
VEVAGRVTLGDSSKAVREAIRELINTDHKKVLLNLSEVTYIDSAGIGELVSSLTSVASLGGSLKLLKPSKRVSDLLRLAKIYGVFEVHDDEETAARSFGP